VYESTVYPGATEGDCIPALERTTGLRAGRDFAVGYSPERINVGDHEHRFETIAKVIAAQEAPTLDVIAKVYGSVVERLHQAPSIKIAEAAKVLGLFGSFPRFRCRSIRATARNKPWTRKTAPRERTSASVSENTAHHARVLAGRANMLTCDDFTKLSTGPMTPANRLSSASFRPRAFVAMVRCSEGVLAAVSATGIGLMLGIFGAAAEQRP
jgi:hypothetical protein